jgi:hypothetical protein
MQICQNYSYSQSNEHLEHERDTSKLNVWRAFTNTEVQSIFLCRKNSNSNVYLDMLENYTSLQSDGCV